MSRRLIAFGVHQGIQEGEHRKAGDGKRQEGQARDCESGSGSDFAIETEIDGD